MIIESTQNHKIKNLTRLYTDNRFRRKSGVFVVEGTQENERAIKFGCEAVEFFIAQDIFCGELPQAIIHYISKSIFEKIAYRGDSGGILGVFKVPQNELRDYVPAKNSTVVVIEGAEKPGNIGAILRSCEAFGIDALIIADSRTDLFNPNVIRSSVGCLFGMNTYSVTNEEARHFLTKNNFQICTTMMSEAAHHLHKVDLTRKSAIIFGTEHSGISRFWQDTGQNVLIPMAGTIDSLNLSNAVAIVSYEALRQKLT